MKQITAIVKPFKLEEVREALAECGGRRIFRHLPDKSSLENVTDCDSSIFKMNDLRKAEIGGLTEVGRSLADAKRCRLIVEIRGYSGIRGCPRMGGGTSVQHLTKHLTDCHPNPRLP